MTIFTLFSRYDSNAPLPTPPTDSHVGETAPLPEVDTKPTTASKMKEAGSYERLRDDLPERHNVPNESGIGLEDMSNKNHDTKNDLHEPKKVESVV